MVIHHTTPTALCGDPGRLQQILINLTGNAIKFTEKGQVVIHVSSIEEMGEEVKLQFEVQDTGIGIPKKAQSTLFEPFIQADGSTTRKYGGTGLGLAISKQLVEMMDGQIGVNSEINKGTTFWFTARFEKQQKKKTLQAVQGSDQLAGKRVLFVDDSEVNRKILVEQVMSTKLDVSVVGNSEDALNQLRQAVDQNKPFDLAVVDLVMPQVNGMELIETIRNDPSIKSIPLILMKAGFAKIDHKQLQALDISNCLSKPVKQSHLLTALVNVLVGDHPKNSEHTSSAVQSTEGHGLIQKQEDASGHDDMPSVKILIAEDNPVNRKVAFRQFKKIGYTVDLVNNGREAVEAVEQGGYDIVFMDCQMPEMDGYQATAEIRRREGDDKHTRIVAMTAHAMQGDRQVCLDAGMDDYIAKPIKMDQLRSVIQRQSKELGENAMDDSQSVPSQKPDAAVSPPVDLQCLSEAAGDDPDELRELTELYLEQTNSQIDQIRQAVEVESAKDIEQLAHGCKGASSNCGIQGLADIMASLEKAGRENQLKDVTQLFEQAENEFQRVRKFLEEHVDMVN